MRAMPVPNLAKMFSRTSIPDAFKVIHPRTQPPTNARRQSPSPSPSPLLSPSHTRTHTVSHTHHSHLYPQVYLSIRTHAHAHTNTQVLMQWVLRVFAFDVSLSADRKALRVVVHPCRKQISKNLVSRVKPIIMDVPLNQQQKVHTSYM